MHMEVQFHIKCKVYKLDLENLRVNDVYTL